MLSEVLVILHVDVIEECGVVHDDRGLAKVANANEWWNLAPFVFAEVFVVP